MPKKGEETRRRIVAAANMLFYERGYANTSFADIAAASGVPKGNFYFYFRSKSDLLGAVIDRRKDEFSSLFKTIEGQHGDPLARLEALLERMLKSGVNLPAWGCRTGTLNAELGKGDESDAARARTLFTILISWCSEQFGQILAQDAADIQARRFVSRIQGMAMITHAFRDPQWIDQESADIQDWLRSFQYPQTTTGMAS